jgi:hypothetical protein
MTIIIVWAYCDVCGCNTEHPFVMDDGIFEVYVCQNCGKLVQYAVR